MDRRAAEEITTVLQIAAQNVADTLDIYRRYQPEKNQPFTDAIVEIMFTIYNTMSPILAEHPDLAPKDPHVDK